MSRPARWRATGRWLGTGWFLGAVGLLMLNDHVLKARYGNWWTGKLSDLAGPVVIAGLLATVASRRTAIIVTVLAFAALKTVPGVAEATAPVLGGVTMRDPTDLIGLAALVPTWFWLDPRNLDLPDRARTPLRLMTNRSAGGTALVVDRRPVRTGIGSVRADDGSARPWRRMVAGVLPVLGAATAVVATTATSCGVPDSVAAIRQSDGAVHAVVQERFSTDQTWFRSADAGSTWQPTEPRTDLGVEPPQDYRTVVADPGPSESCGPHGVCFRVDEEAHEVLRSLDAGATWSVDLRLPSSDIKRATNLCMVPADPLAAVEVSGHAQGDVAIVTMAGMGVLVRDPVAADGSTAPIEGVDGEVGPEDSRARRVGDAEYPSAWRAVAVGDADISPTGPRLRIDVSMGFVYAVAIVVGLIVAVRSQRGRRNRLAAAGFFMCVVGVSSFVVIAAGVFGRHGDRIRWPVTLLATLVVAGGTVVVVIAERRSARRRDAWTAQLPSYPAAASSLPPPPPPPPPPTWTPSPPPVDDD